MKILAIESSCDETSVAVLEKKEDTITTVLSNVTATSLSIHASTGGIIPENAARMQVNYIMPVLIEALNDSKGNLEKANREKARKTLYENIDAIAVTYGPGLIGSLLVGVETAKTLSLAFDKPLIPVNHLLAHIFANYINRKDSKILFPFIGLIVSGGHTDLLLFKSISDFHWLGGTRDDAAGEAFDKTGKMLGLGYPAGPEIDKRAALGKPIFKFSEANLPGFDFSFSGFKTSVLYFLKSQVKEDLHFIENNLNDLCASVQNSILNMLLSKLEKAAKETGIMQIAIAGGVAANKGLRQRLTELAVKLNWQIYIPEFQYCTDNAGMIAIAAWYKFKNGEFAESTSSPEPRWRMEDD